MREQILAGNLELPGYQTFKKAYGPAITRLADNMFSAMWRAYMKDKSFINLTYWSDRFNNPKMFNLVLMSLSKAGWIHCNTIPARNWSEATIVESKLLEYITVDELEYVRAYKKFTQYIPDCTDSTINRGTRVNKTEKDTGLVRSGFMKAGNSKYKYATEYISDYYDIIQQNTTKSMDKIQEIYPDMKSDRATYDTISVEVLDAVMNSDNIYTTGNNYNDSRGRAISSCLGKVFNPIGFKDARALLVIGE